MTPKLVYTLNGVTKTHVFSPDQYTTFNQGWESDEIEYKNPFTGKKEWKRRGYYYRAVFTIDGAEYELAENFRDLFNTSITDRKFYPNQDNDKEYYDVEVSESIEFDDDHAAMAILNLEITFRSKERYDTPFNYPLHYWGDRRHTFDELTALFTDFNAWEG